MRILHVTKNRKCTILHTFVSSILIYIQLDLHLLCLLLSISLVSELLATVALPRS